MAERVLFIGWNRPARGREEKAVESFNDIVGLFGRMQQEGRLEKLDIVFLDPHGGDLGGCFMLHCSAEQLHAIQEDDEFRDEMTRADVCVDGLGMIEGFTGDAIAREMERYMKAVGQVPQAA
jgi:hypothetical protein